jgi:hypothetical protein
LNQVQQKLYLTPFIIWWIEIGNVNVPDVLFCLFNQARSLPGERRSTERLEGHFPQVFYKFRLLAA